jgi:FMN hydrolase / 5-amino-6-(5-phospho-D-ribitylamino)uracil phosphatase
MSSRQRHERLAPFDPPPKLVLFDLDDTLCDYDRARLTRLRHAFQPWFADAERLDAIVDAAYNATDWEGGDVFGSVLSVHGLADPAVAAEARARFVSDRYRGLGLFEEAREVIEAVAQVLPIGMITNGPSEIQWPKIRLLELEELFPVIVVSEDVGVWKPDPAIFAIALERCGFAPEEAVYIGDSVVADVPGAQAAGLRAVWMNRARRPWPGAGTPDAVVHSLHDVLPLVGIGNEPGLAR